MDLGSQQDAVGVEYSIVKEESVIQDQIAEVYKESYEQIQWVLQMIMAYAEQ